MSLREPLCHDLLQLDAAGCGQLAAGAPAWVREALARAPWGVVRRAGWRGDAIAVGVRGPTRAQRHAGWVDVRHIQACLRPSELMPPWCLRAQRTEAAGGALLALGRVMPTLFQSCGWSDAGPGGSWGFEIASGLPSTHADSDLDLVVRLARPPAPALARHWLQTLQQAVGAVRVDALLELPFGGLALAELAGLAPLADGVGRTDHVLLRRAEGPQLHTWATLAAHAEVQAQAACGSRT